MRRLLLVFLLGSVSGCRGGSGPEAAPTGGLALEWSGKISGHFVAPATALWCARDSLLEVMAASHDTAAGFNLLPSDTLVAMGYSVFSAQVFTPFRPQANLALRFLRETELKAFESLSGTIQVTRLAGGRISGTLEALLRQQGGADSVRVTGRFREVAIAAASSACGRANRPAGG